MKSQTFFGGVFVLFIGGLLAKVLGAVFRVPLTWILGTEGLGLYQLVFPVFSLLIVLASSGMPTSISKMVAERKERGDKRGVQQVFRVSLIFMAIVGAVFSLILLLSAQGLANLQGNTLCSLGYLGIAPAVFFVCILSVFRGYFQGQSNMTPTALSQIIEQAGKLAFGLLGAYLLIGYGIEYGAFGAILGVTISEILAVLVLCIIYLKDKKSNLNSAQNGVHSTVHNINRYSVERKLNYKSSIFLKRKDTKSINTKRSAKNSAIFRELIKTSVPIVLASITLPLIVMIDSFLVVNLLGRAGFTESASTQLWGIESGVVTSLINMPVALSLAVAISIVPAVARLKDNSASIEKINQALLLCILLALPVAFVFVLYPQLITQFVYQNTLGGAVFNRISANLLTVSAPIVVLGSILQVQNSSLQGLGYGRATMINMILAGVLKVLLTVLLVRNPHFNIYGCALSNLAFYAVATLLNAIYLRKKLGFKFEYKKLTPSVAGVVLIVFYSLNILLLPISLNLKLILGILGSAVLYLFTLWLFGQVSPKQMLKSLKLRNRKI